MKELQRYMVWFKKNQPMERQLVQVCTIITNNETCWRKNSSRGLGEDSVCTHKIINTSLRTHARRNSTFRTHKWNSHWLYDFSAKMAFCVFYCVLELPFECYCLFSCILIQPIHFDEIQCFLLYHYASIQIFDFFNVWILALFFVC